MTELEQIQSTFTKGLQLILQAYNDLLALKTPRATRLQGTLSAPVLKPEG
jgi:hypothetical protein